MPKKFIEIPESSKSLAEATGKPYVLVESEGTATSTKISVVDSNGFKQLIPYVQEAIWTSSVLRKSKIDTLTLKIINPKFMGKGFPKIALEK